MKLNELFLQNSQRNSNNDFLAFEYFPVFSENLDSLFVVLDCFDEGFESNVEAFCNFLEQLSITFLRQVVSAKHGSVFVVFG